MGGETAAAVASRLAAQAAANGNRPSIVLAEIDSRCWIILASGGPSRAGDALVLDEYGDLWWVRMTGLFAARITRKCWPEEAEMFGDVISAVMDGVAGVRAGAMN